MVLDAGSIVKTILSYLYNRRSYFAWQVEFASPRELLKNKHGKLRALVDESEDRDVLLAMAEGKATP